ncbi:6-phospho-3-hexuloisomerase [Frigoribacterium salinisoli]
MTTPDTARPDASPVDSLTAVAAELAGVVERVADDQGDALDALAAAVGGAPRVFVHGTGRSGLALQMTAMRLMHLGFTVHVVGEVTSPALAEGDLLLTASGSGTTGGIVRAAETARDVGARVAALTTDAGSPLADLAEVVVVVPAAGKQDRSGQASAQYAGSLFEQAVVLLGDALFDALWHRSGATADELWPRHANVE